MKPSNSPAGPRPGPAPPGAPARRGAARGRASHTHQTAGRDPSPCPLHLRDARAAETAGRTERSWGARNRSHGRPRSAEVLPETPTQSTAHSPFQASRGKARDFGVSLLHQQGVRLWTSSCRRRGLRGGQAGPPERRRGSGVQVPGSGIAARPRRSAPRLGPHSLHPRPQAAVAARHPRSSAEDPLPRAGAFVPLTDPLHRAGQRGSSRGAPASSRLRSHAQVSITLKVGATLGGGRGAERDVLSAPRAGSTPPRRQTHQRAQRPRLPDTFQAPKPRQEPSGPAGRTSLSGSWRVARLAGRSRTSKVTAVLYPSENAPGEGGGEGRAAGRDARRITLRSPDPAALLVPRPREPNAESPNWRTQ